MSCSSSCFFFFFLNKPPPTKTSPLPLPTPLRSRFEEVKHARRAVLAGRIVGGSGEPSRARAVRDWSHLRSRSEEHTSELQSQSNLVFRLLLEKKKNNESTSPDELAVMTSTLTVV